MPFTILGGQSPHLVLVPQENVFSLPPNIFNCASFIHQQLQALINLMRDLFKCISVDILTQKRVSVL